MTRTLELVVKVANPKSPNMNNLGSGTHCNELLGRPEIFSALDLSNTKYRLGMLILKSKYFDNAYDRKIELLKYIKSICQAMKLVYSDIAAVIIINMLTNTPIPSQYKKLKYLYKQFGLKAKSSLRKQKKIKNQLDELFEDNYQVEQLQKNLQYEESNLERSAEERSQSTTLCPKCQGNTGCNLCHSGYIHITMDDALKFFVMQDISNISGQFLTRYWEPILSIFRQLKRMEKEAVYQMSLIREQINRVNDYHLPA